MVPGQERTMADCAVCIHGAGQNGDVVLVKYLVEDRDSRIRTFVFVFLVLFHLCTLHKQMKNDSRYGPQRRLGEGCRALNHDDAG